jgi:hypothetical protein
MIEQWSALCSPSYSYLVNYQIQSDMYNCWDKNTEKAQWLRVSGIGVWTASNVITVVTRIAGIAEVFIKGSSALLSTPFKENKINNVKVGLNEICVHMPKNILRTIFVPVEFIGGTIFILAGPKTFTMEMVECMKVNLSHAKNGTLHSVEHKKDLGFVDGIVKPKFMAYQKRASKRIATLPHN